MNSSKAVVLLVLLLLSSVSLYAADSDLDPTFTVGSGLGNTPLALARQADGKFIVGGNFEVVAGARRNKIARLNADGSLDTSFTNGSGVDGNGIVWAAAVQSDGKVLIGGEFFSVNGVARSFLARLNADASLDTTFTPQISDRVMRIAVQPDGKILILGDFQTVNGSFQSRRLARLNADGTQDLSFTNSQGSDIGNTLFKLQPDGKILAIGPQRLIRLNADGSLDTFNQGGSGMTFSNVSSIELDAANNIYVAGSITAYNGVPRTHLIRVFPDGSLDTGFNPAFPPDSTSIVGAHAVGIQADGKVVFSGFFNLSAGGARQGVVRLNSDGSLDPSFDSSVSYNVVVSQIVIQPDQRIVVGGQFTMVGSTQRNRIARLNSDGSVDGTFARKRGPDDTVFCLAPLADGKVLIGGFFTAVDEVPAGAIARLMPNGLLDTSFNTGSGFVGVIARISPQPDGKILAGGFFTSFNGTTRMNIARLNADGSLDSSFDAGASVDGFVLDIAIQPDGKIIIVGLFKSVGGVDGRHIARLNANGTLDLSFNPGTGADFEIDDVELQPNGQILIAGGFASFNGTPRKSIARLNSTGGLDMTFNTSTQFDGPVFSVATQPDGRIVVGGAFNNVNSQPRNHVARLNSNGAVDATFLLGSGFTGDAVFKVALQTDGKIVIGGTFLSIGTSGRPKIARLNTNGTVDTAFNAGGISGGVGETEVDDIAILANGKILFSGEFTTVNAVEANRVSRLIGTFVAQNFAPFDFDGDGKTDIGIFRPAASGGEWWINRSGNGQTFALQFGASTDKIVPADYTGDGKADITFWRPSTGEWYVLRSEDNSFFAFPFGANGDTPVPADYDADGKADAAVFRPSSATWFISQSGGGGTLIFQFGVTGDLPVVSDYDGDGKADVGIFRAAASGAEWWINRSTAGLLAMQFGANTDKAVQGDYTGDGKTDIAIWRPSTGEWFIVRSEDFSFFAFPFGANGDVIAPGDYDGDGKTDPTVFRPSQSTWFIARSTAGTQIVQFGANGDQPIPNAFVP